MIIKEVCKIKHWRKILLLEKNNKIIIHNYKYLDKINTSVSYVISDNKLLEKIRKVIIENDEIH